MGNSIGLPGSRGWKKHYRKSDFVLVKSLVPFHGQVNKALRSISHWLVSRLAPTFIRWWIQPWPTRMLLLPISLHRSWREMGGSSVCKENFFWCPISKRFCDGVSYFIINKKVTSENIIIILCIPKIIIKNFYFFSLQYISMSGKNINFDDKKIKKKQVL